MFGSIDFSESTEFRGQMMMLGGIALLIWVMFRRNIRGRTLRRTETQELVEHRKAIEPGIKSGAPLANAPVELLRWQSAMFDLQRDLKAELETKIAVVQSVVRLADERIATLSRMGKDLGDGGSPLLSQDLIDRARRIGTLTRQGRTSTEIAEELAMPLGDVELLQSLAK